MVTFVLVHGGGFAGSCWDLLAPLLDRPTVAVDLPGRGSRPAHPADVSVGDYVEAVTAEIVSGNLTDVVLVGHSMAGIVLPGVMGRIPERLGRVVFLASAVPAQGQTVAEILSTLGPVAAEVAVRLGDEAMTQNGALHPDLARAMFCNDMDASQTAFTLGRLVPESLNVINEPVDLSGLQHHVPKTYVRLLQDASIVPEAQDAMIANLGDCDVVDLDAGHMAMISRPKELAALLNAL